MAILPLRRSPARTVLLPLVPVPAPIAPLVAEAARAKRIRRAVGVARNVSALVTAVPFVPLRARVAAGAVTGVAAAVDAALRSAGERLVSPSAPQPDDDAILHDPALFAADAASVLTTGAVAASQALVSTARHPVVRRTVRVAIVAGIIFTVSVVGYRLVVAPALERRRQRRRDAMVPVVAPDTFDVAEAAPATGDEVVAEAAGDVPAPVAVEAAAAAESAPVPHRRPRRKRTADLPAPASDAG